MLEAIAPLALTLTLTALLVAPALAQDPPDPPGFGPPPSLGAGGMGPGGFGPSGGPMQRGDLKVLEQFDADHDGRLSPAERTEARAWLKTNRPRRGGPGGPGGPGGFGGPDGFRPGRGGERDGERNDAPADRHGVRVLPGEVASFADRALFDPEVVRTIFLQFPQDDWFAELEETHTSQPLLNFFRSPSADRSWVTASGAILDAASLINSTVDAGWHPMAGLCVFPSLFMLRYGTAISQFVSAPSGETLAAALRHQKSY